VSRPEGYGVQWNARADLTGQAPDRPWFAEPATLVIAVELLAATELWPLLTVIGQRGEVGVPLGTTSQVLDMIVAGAPCVTVLAAGPPIAAQQLDLAELSISLDVMPGAFGLQIRVEGAALDRLGRAVLDDGIALLCGLHQAWADRARWLDGYAAPFSTGRFIYPRPRPPRAASHSVRAIVDVCAPGSALAVATTPAGATRSACADGVVVLRWADDPRDVDAVGRASGRHEAWLASVIETRIADGWNQLGDAHVPVRRIGRAEPFRVLDLAESVAYLDVALPIDWARVDAIARQLPEGVSELRLIAPSREAALELYPPARVRGIARVMYLSQSGSLWDPDPPGPWLSTSCAGPP
jgi:hypothetical protein